MDKQEAIKRLQEMLKPEDVVFTILRHVSQSGMTRDISLVIPTNHRGVDGIMCIDYLASRAMDMKIKNDGLRIGGCGMDMGFALVYDLAYTVFGEGYALKQRWL